MPLAKELQQAVNLFLAQIDQINPYDAAFQNVSQNPDTDAQNKFRQFCNDYICHLLDNPHNRHSLLSLLSSEGQTGREDFFLELLKNNKRIEKLILVQQYSPYRIMQIFIGMYCSIVNTPGNHYLVKQQFESFFFGVLDKNHNLLITAQAYKKEEPYGPFGNPTSWKDKWDHIFPLYFTYLASKKHPSEPNIHEESIRRRWDEKSLKQKIQTILTSLGQIWSDLGPRKSFSMCFPKTNQWHNQYVAADSSDAMNPIPRLIHTVSEKKMTSSIELGLFEYLYNMNVTTSLRKTIAYTTLLKNSPVMSAIFTALSQSQQKYYQKNPILSNLRTDSEFKSQLIVKAAANKRRNPKNATTSGIDYLVQEHTSTFFRRGRTHSGDVAERISLAKPLLLSQSFNDGIGARFLSETLTTSIKPPLPEQISTFITALANLLDKMEKRKKDTVKINLVFEGFKALAESLKDITTSAEIVSKIDTWEDQGHHNFHNKTLTNKALLNENRNSWWKKKTTQVMEDFLQLKAELEVVKQDSEQIRCANT